MHYSSAPATIYNFGHLGSGLGEGVRPDVGDDFGANFGAFTSSGTAADWSGRVAGGQHAVTMAKTVAPQASALFFGADTALAEARRKIAFANANDQWTQQQEEAVASLLEQARGFWGQAQGVYGRTFPVAFPTWRGVTLGIPSGGVVPPILPALPEVAPPGGVPGGGGAPGATVARAGMGVAGLIALAIGAAFLLRR